MARPIPPRSADPARHPAYPTHRWWNESLYARLSRLCMFHPVGADELAQAVERALRTKNVLLGAKLPAGASHAQPPLIASKLGLPDEQFNQALGVDLMPFEERVGNPLILSKTLRYCRLCLELGFHSMVYQHRAITTCDFHGIPLLDRCHDCGCAVVPLIKDLSKHPYCCNHCGRLFIKTVVAGDAVDAGNAAQDIDGGISRWRMDLRVDPQDHWQRAPMKSWLAEAADLSRDPARRLRHLQRAAVWPLSPARRWPFFKEWSCGVDAPNQQPPPVKYTGQLEPMLPYPTHALCWLRDQCAAHWEESLRLIANSWLRIQYITPQYLENALSVVAVALHLTMTKYGIYGVNFRAPAIGYASSAPYTDVCWNGQHCGSTPECHGRASGMLVAMEILGYFALCLRRCAGLGRGGLGPVERAGHEYFDPCTYVPAWQLGRDGRRWILRARPRTTEKLLTWLLRRYRHEPLRRSVVCMPPDRDRYRFYRQPEVWSGFFSDVLLQFPRVVPTDEMTEQMATEE